MTQNTKNKGIIFGLVNKIIIIASIFFSQMLMANNYLYTMTNNLNNNAVLGYKIKSSGKLVKLSGSPFSTEGGLSQGTPPHTQNGIIKSKDGKYLFVTNLSSNDISIFRVKRNGKLVHVRNAPTGGFKPASLALSDDILYVSHLGTSDFFCYFCDYRGFRFDRESEDLIPIPDSVIELPLNPQGFVHAIQFSPDGLTLLGTRSSSNHIDSFYLDRDTGLLTAANGSPFNSEDNQPKGIVFNPVNSEQFFVSNMVELDQKPSSISSYQIDYSSGLISTLSDGSYSTNGEESTAVGIVLPSHGRDLYSTNTRSDSISHFKVTHDGVLIFNDNFKVPGTNKKNHEPLDMVITPNDKYLYTVTSGVAGIIGYKIKNNGSLRVISTINPKFLFRKIAPYGLVIIEKNKR